MITLDIGLKHYYRNSYRCYLRTPIGNPQPAPMSRHICGILKCAGLETDTFKVPNKKRAYCHGGQRQEEAAPHRGREEESHRWGTEERETRRVVERRSSPWPCSARPPPRTGSGGGEVHRLRARLCQQPPDHERLLLPPDLLREVTPTPPARRGGETREMEGREMQERERESERRTRDAQEIEREEGERHERWEG